MARKRNMEKETKEKTAKPKKGTAARGSAPEKAPAKKAAAKKPAAGKAAPKKAPAKKRPPKKAVPPEAPKKPAVRVGTVALLGRPNVGKSTLINALLGQKIAIVSNKPQTTRISILGIKTTDRGQIIFVDNPGIHKPLHSLNRRMMNFVFSSLETADLLCLLIDATQPFGHGDEFVIQVLREIKLRPIFLLINKVDAVRKDKVLPIIERYKDLLPFKEIVPISALTGINLGVLEDLILKALPEAEKVYSDDEISDQSERFLLAEIIREKVLNHVEQELPFETAVYIDSIERKTQADKDGNPRPLTFIQASVFVEKDNQRKIIIGRGGSLIKTIGTEARREIEEVLETKVYLALQVRWRPQWRDSEDVLDLIEGQKR
jgi:GTP-binding protein Era